ncbi:MAG TPA: tryptophan synthase subunit alpha [Solirubrobacterales bacterium]|jgi:tryptophan synthase alpha chain|nr:tryptophan synthase subunit alpha [Solirubrobacterales bacterium]
MAETGVERIAAAFTRARGDGRAALMPYLMGGFPDMATSAAVIDAYADTGADLIELGVPYSDPLADGPQIHAAATAALEAGARFEGVMELCERVSGRLPVLPMVYANVVLTLGAERFAAALATAGAAGAIIPDLPRDEDPSVAAALLERGLAPIGFVSPTTSPERLREIAAAAVGFTYVVSLTGVTGERSELPPELGTMVAAVRDASDAPAAVGFGIGTPEQAARVGEIADGVIIGTRLVRAVADADGRAAAVDAVAEFLADARTAL